MEEKSGDMSEIEKLLIDSAPILRVLFKDMPEEVLLFTKFINAVKLFSSTFALLTRLKTIILEVALYLHK
jgi:hypothetical protein